MASPNAFCPQGPTTLVDNTARLIGNSFGPSNCYRVLNLSASVQYFTHGLTSSVTSVGAPSAGVPSANTIGMEPNTVEVFTNLLPYMIASSATGFLVTPGDGV